MRLCWMGLAKDNQVVGVRLDKVDRRSFLCLSSCWASIACLHLANILLAKWVRNRRILHSGIFGCEFLCCMTLKTKGFSYKTEAFKNGWRWRESNSRP